jgi:hypothetical protein
LAWIFDLLILLCLAAIVLVFQIRDRDNQAARSGSNADSGRAQFFTHSQIAPASAIWLWVAMPETN